MHVMLQDVWKRTVEIQISRSKSNDLTIVCGWYTKEKMRTALKFSPCGPCVCVRVCVLLEFGQHTLALGVVWVVHNLGSASRKL